MTTVLKTEKSSLVLHDLEPEIIKLIEKCVESVDPELDVNPPIMIFGNTCYQHRSIGFYSNTSAGYNYSTTLTPSKKLHGCLAQLLAYVNNKFAGEFNGILINKYSSGEDYIGKHSDDEHGLDSKVGVIAISYGSVRKFRIRNKATGQKVLDVSTDPKKIIQMAGQFQKEFTHEVPIEKKVTGSRYSFTFRKHLK